VTDKDTSREDLQKMVEDDMDGEE